MPSHEAQLFSNLSNTIQKYRIMRKRRRHHTCIRHAFTRILRQQRAVALNWLIFRLLISPDEAGDVGGHGVDQFGADDVAGAGDLFVRVPKYGMRV